MNSRSGAIIVGTLDLKNDEKLYTCKLQMSSLYIIHRLKLTQMCNRLGVSHVYTVLQGQ